MKRIGALICVMMMAVTLLAPACFAANNDEGTAASKATLTLEESSPEDGATGVAVDNLSIKLKFNKEMQPATEKAKKANAKQFKLTDSEGNKIPIKVYYSEEELGLVLVAADVYTKGKNQQIKGDETYTLSIGSDVRATDGAKLGTMHKVKMKTLNQSRSTAIYMILMVLMMGGMIFFTMRSAKKAEEKKKEEKKAAKDGVNPYKEAKKSGKSVSEIVAKENKKKAKQAEAERREREAEEALEAEILEKMRKESNKRVSAPRPIKAAGSTLRLKVVKEEKAEEKVEGNKSNKGTTRPKNQSGKKKNKGAKKK